MVKLIYSAITSLDGYTADANGDFGWGEPDAEVFSFLNDLERGFGTSLYGRRMYETLVYWETYDEDEDVKSFAQYFAEIWRAADKVVFSRTLEAVSSANTRIERVFDPNAVLRMKATEARDLSIGGPELAGQAMAAHLVDELHLFVSPVTLGGGKSTLPAQFRSDLQLLDVDRFASGVVHLHYRVGE